MRHREHGFTLIELLIVIAVLVVIATIAIPNLLSSRLAANETTAIQSLKSILAAQAQCQVSRTIDENADGTGEFGYLGELAGATFVRDGGGLSTTIRMSPPLLSQSFGMVADGCVMRSGYLFRIYLPDSSGGFVGEAATGGAVAGAVDPSRADVMWCCYAWPLDFANTGRRAFFVDQRGDVLGCRNSGARYGGAAGGPVAGTACFVAAGSAMDGQLAINTVAADGETWTVVN